MKMETTAQPKKKIFTASRVTLFAMVLPFIVLIVAFSYIPLFGWIFAFYDYKPGIPLADSTFAGLKYFRIVFEDKEDLIRVMRNTLVLGFLSLLVSPLPAIMAIMLNEIFWKPFKRIVQTLTTLPNFISWIIVMSLATAMFASDGLWNSLLLKWNVIESPSNVLANSAAAWYFQTGVAIWKSLGWGSIIYLAAIAGIDAELYDAAKVDGAGRFQRILHVTVPGLWPTFFVLTLLGIAGILSANGFEQYFVFYNSRVANQIETLDYYVYRLGILNADISFATAVGMAKTIVSIVLLFLVNALSRKVRGQSVF